MKLILLLFCLALIFSISYLNRKSGHSIESQQELLADPKQIPIGEDDMLNSNRAAEMPIGQEDFSSNRAAEMPIGQEDFGSTRAAEMPIGQEDFGSTRAAEMPIGQEDLSSNRAAVADRRKPTQPQKIHHVEQDLGSSSHADSFRRVIVPQQGPEEFLKAAKWSTRIYIETCGILAGVLEGNDLVVTHVILPKQTGSGNSVEARDDMDLFNFQIGNNLMTLGWIHTHPSQHAFLSSIDLHTQYGYQCQLDEAISIVMAPRSKRSMGIFTLTKKGMSVISNCNERGFHAHYGGVAGLYQKANHHIFVSKKNISVVDLREPGFHGHPQGRRASGPASESSHLNV